MMDDLGLFWINPVEVEACLRNADFQYPFRAEADFAKGWANFAAIPGLYRLTRNLGHFPSSDEGMAFLMEHCDPLYQDDDKVIRRGQKLYMDYCRDVHTLGMLQQCEVLAYVWYQKALDLSMNVDYLASLLTTIDPDRAQVAIQAAMRGRNYDWEAGPLERLKEERRRRRGERGWQGVVYWLTNRRRPYHQSINRCWLFGPGHIDDLAEEIRGNGNEGIVAIQAEMAF